MKPRPFFRILAAVPLAWFASAGPPAHGQELGPPAAAERSRAIREAIRAGLPKYQRRPEEEEVTMRESGDGTVEKDGTLNLPKVTVEAKVLPRVKEYDFLTPKGRLEAALKRHPGIKIGNLFGLNNGIAMAMLWEERQVEKINELTDQVERVSLDDSADTKKLHRLLDEAIYRPSADWLKGRSGR